MYMYLCSCVLNSLACQKTLCLQTVKETINYVQCLHSSCSSLQETGRIAKFHHRFAKLTILSFESPNHDQFISISFKFIFVFLSISFVKYSNCQQYRWIAFSELSKHNCTICLHKSYRSPHWFPNISYCYDEILNEPNYTHHNGTDNIFSDVLNLPKSTSSCE